MNWVDLLIVAVIAFTAFRAFSNGLVRELVTLVALVLGVVLAGLFYDDLAANLGFVIDDAPTRGLIAFVAIVAGIAVAGHVIGLVLRGAAALLMLGPLDHIGGAVFGVVKGIVLVGVALIAVSVFPAQETVSRGVADSRLAPYFLERLPLVQMALPGEFSNPLDQLERWRELADRAVPTPSATPR